MVGDPRLATRDATTRRCDFRSLTVSGLNMVVSDASVQDGDEVWKLHLRLPDLSNEGNPLPTGRRTMSTTTILIIVVVLILFGGGWGYSRRGR